MSPWLSTVDNRGVETDVQEEAKRLKRLPSFLFLFVFNFLFPLFFFWPGFLADPLLSPLEKFFRERYSPWFLVLFFFSLGAGIIAIPIWISDHLYLTRIAPLIFKGRKGSRRYYLLKIAQSIIGLFPLLSLFVVWFVSSWNPIRALLLFLARRKGYQQGMEGGLLNIELAAFYWFLNGFFFIFSVLGFFRYIQFKQMTEQYLGKPVRELPKPEISWTERLKDVGGLLVFGVLVPLFSLGGVFILFFLFWMGLFQLLDTFLLISSLVPGLVVAIVSPVSWKLFKDHRYKTAANVLFGSAILFAILDLIGPLILFFPPSITDVLPFIMGGGFHIVIFCIIGFWLRYK